MDRGPSARAHPRPTHFTIGKEPQVLLEQIYLDHKRQAGLGSCKAKVGENVPR